MVLIIQGGSFFETCFHLKKVVETLLVYGSTSKPRLALSVEELSRTTMIPLHTLSVKDFFSLFFWKYLLLLTIVFCFAFSVYSPTTEEHRIPHTIWEAKCSHSDCPEPSQPDGARNNAVPIYQNLLVLHRRQEENCYVASHRMVAVGCTCVRPDIVH